MPLLASPNRGYADWQRVENWDTGLLFNSTGTATNTSIQSAILDVSRVGYLAGFMSISQNNAPISFTWYDTAAGGNTLAFRQYNLSANVNNIAQIRIPNMGPYVQILVGNFLGVTYSYSVFIWGTNRTHPLELIPQGPFLIQHTNVAVAAGGTNTYYPSDYYAGPIFVTATSPAAFTVRMNVLDNTNALQALLTAPTVANGFFQQAVIAPPGTWNMSIQNTSGAASTESLRVWYSTTGAA